MKADERKFLADVFKYRLIGGLEHKSPRVLINEPSFTMHYKRAWYLLEKWTDKGWYDYGVTEDLGWLTEEGKKQARSLLETS